MNSSESLSWRGSPVLVTGANGFIASHLVDQLLREGFKIRGTVRYSEKQTWLEEIFHRRHDPGLFTVVVVPDIAVPGSCDEAMKGCSGIIHSAADMTKTPTIQRFVYTSTCNAAHEPKANTFYHITSESWSNKSVEDAFAGFPAPPNQCLIAYYAAKCQAEKAAWRFMQEGKPHFTFNCVLINMNTGPILTPNHPTGSATGLKQIYEGNPLLSQIYGNEVILPPQRIVDVRDSARLHVAALKRKDVENERIFSAAEGFNFNTLIRMMRSFAPKDKVLLLEREGLATNGQTVDDRRSLELLKSYGQVGWSSVVQALCENCLGEGARGQSSTPLI